MLYCVRAVLLEVSREGWILWVRWYPPVLENTASLALVSLSDLEQRRLLVWLLWVWIGEGGGGRGGARIGSQREEDVYEICARARFLQIFGKYFFKLVESISPVKNWKRCVWDMCPGQVSCKEVGNAKKAAQLELWQHDCQLSGLEEFDNSWQRTTFDSIAG